MSDIFNKSTSIIVQSAADAVFDEVQLSESERTDKAIKIVRTALDKAHAGAMAIREAKPLHNLLTEYKRQDAIALIHKFVKKYSKFINATTPITGRWVINEKDYYADKTNEFIKNDVKFTIFIIYFAAITEEGVKMAITKALKPVFGVAKEMLKTNSGGM